MLPSSTKSLTPVTVIVCGVDQLAMVKVADAGDTVPSAALELVTLTVTVFVSVGWLVSTTLKVAVPPASVVTKPEVGETVMPAASSF